MGPFRVLPPLFLSPSLPSFQLSPHSCNSLIHYTISIQLLLLLLLVFLCCLVSCFPSQYSPLSITSLSLRFVGGSTLFRPPFIYFRTPSLSTSLLLMHLTLLPTLTYILLPIVLLSRCAFGFGLPLFPKEGAMRPLGPPNPPTGPPLPLLIV